MYDEIFDISLGKAYLYCIKNARCPERILGYIKGALMLTYIGGRSGSLIIYAREADGGSGNRLCDFVRLSCVCSRGGCHTMSRACRALCHGGIVPLATSCSEGEIIFLCRRGEGDAAKEALCGEFFVL